VGKEKRQQSEPTASAVRDPLPAMVGQLYEFGPFRLDPAERRLLRGDEIIALTPKMFDTLLALVRNSGHLLEKDELIGMLWPDSFVEEGSLANHISLLRKALGEDPAFIETVPKRGYRFVGTVRRLPSAAPTYVERLPEVDDPGIAVVPAKIQPLWRSRAALGITASALITSLAAAGWYYKFVARSEAIYSVAVLPFVNASGDPNAEYLSDGITESLIDSLSQLPQLKVMSRDATFRYRGKETDIQKVGRELRVRAVFKGRVTQRAGSLDISAELIDVRDNSHVWGEQYSRKPSDIVVLQGEIAREMTLALRVRLTGEDEKRLTKGYTADSEAYQNYLKGRYWLNKSSEEAVSKGVGYFQQAIIRDPGYALAYSGLSDSHTSLARDGFVPAKEGYLTAKEAALKALEIDDTLAEAHVSLAYIKIESEWDWPAGARESQRAIGLNPSYAPAHDAYAESLWLPGRLDDGIAESKRALELDPLSLAYNDTLGIEFFLARRYGQAIEQEGRTLELDPSFIDAYYFRGISYLKKSMHKEGMAELEKAALISPNDVVAVTGLGYGYAVTGRRTDAQRMLDKLEELSKRKYVSPVWRAKIYAGLGDKDKAFQWLEKAIEDRSVVSVGYIKMNPMFDPLRSDPRYAYLLRRTNLQP